MANEMILGEVVRLEKVRDHVALVTIVRPDARNAVNAVVARALEAAVDSTEGDAEVRVVVITGTGRDAFCAGADLKSLAQGDRRMSTERGGFAGLTRRERKKPWIAAVNGKALAGGMEIVLACDLVVAANHASFGLPEVIRGLIAAAGGMYRLPRAIPRNVALELVLTGGQLEAARAFEFGLVNKLVDYEELLESALALASKIARNAPLAVRESLAIARAATAGEEDDLHAMTGRALERVRASSDYKEGPLAFVEKREPRWLGR